MGIPSNNLTQSALIANAFSVITPFKVIQGRRFWYQSTARIQLPVSQ